MTDVGARARAALLGALVADAATAPLHWIYNAAKLKEVLTTNGDRTADPEFFDPPSCPFYTNTVGALSPYGQELIPLVKFMGNTGGCEPQAWSKDPPLVYINHSAKVMRDAVAEGKTWPECGDALDTQQNNDTAAELGWAAARVLERVITSSDGVEAAIRWALGPEGGVGGKAAEVLAEVLAKKDAPPRSLMYLDGPDVKFGPWGAGCGNPGCLKAALLVAIQASTHSFTRSLRSCCLAKDYVDAVRTNMLLGGDNCSRSVLIGALMAAQEGSAAIPAAWSARTADYGTLEAAVDKLVAARLLGNGLAVADGWAAGGSEPGPPSPAAPGDRAPGDAHGGAAAPWSGVALSLPGAGGEAVSAAAADRSPDPEAAGAPPPAAPRDHSAGPEAVPSASARKRRRTSDPSKADAADHKDKGRPAKLRCAAISSDARRDVPSGGPSSGLEGTVAAVSLACGSAGEPLAQPVPDGERLDLGPYRIGERFIMNPQLGETHGPLRVLHVGTVLTEKAILKHVPHDFRYSDMSNRFIPSLAEEDTCLMPPPPPQSGGGEEAAAYSMLRAEYDKVVTVVTKITGTHSRRGDARLLTPLVGVGFIEVCGVCPSMPTHEDIIRAAPVFLDVLRRYIKRVSDRIGCSCGKCGAPAVIEFDSKTPAAALLYLTSTTIKPNQTINTSKVKQ
eukprot:XP_001697306.1 predicted protein [Chlamydomonas reinhardtii]